MELLLARNPDSASSLPYLLRLPLDGGLVFRTRGTWPRTSALYCHPVSLDHWPAEPEIVERAALRVCARRGAAIDVVCDRGREQRSQIVFTRARGRDVVFSQSPRTRKQSRPDVRLPSARAQGIEALEVIVDTRERYPYRFAAQQVRTARRGLACGDYAISRDGRVVCAVERKSVSDLLSSLASGRLRFALGELAGLPRAAVVVEESYARIFTQPHLRGAVAADGLAELQVRYPNVPILHCDSRKLAEEWTYRFLAAAYEWAHDEPAIRARIRSSEVLGRPSGTVSLKRRVARVGARQRDRRLRPRTRRPRGAAGMASPGRLRIRWRVRARCQTGAIRPVSVSSVAPRGR